MSARQSEIKKKLNLETFFALWISISLLGLTSVEAQTIVSFIFFLEAKGSHDNLAKSSKERNQFKFLVEKKVSLTHEAKSQPLKMMIYILSIKTHYSQDSQLEFRANVNKIFMNPAKKHVKLHFLPYFMTCASIINERRHIGALSQKRNILIYITSLLRYHTLTSAGMKKLQLIWWQISN